MDKTTDILQEYDSSSKLYENFAYKVRQLLEDLIISEAIPYNAITCRLKSRDSLIKKLEIKQDKYGELRDITDIAGIRIITFYSDDVDKVVDLVEKEFKVDRQNTIDKGKSLEPDRFGYCSVHYIVGLSDDRLKLREYQMYQDLKCEIQIRTVLQHAWAEIEHDLGYKNESIIPKEIRRNFSRLAGLLEIGDKEFLEIRKYLLSYSGDIANKIKDRELNDKELDAIMLNEFVSTDKEIIRINKELAQLFNSQISDKLENYNCADAINRLNWFDIRTLGQLKNFINDNKTSAIKIAQILITPKDVNEKMRMDKTRAIFYLCYAELLNSDYDYQSISRYLKETNIVTEKSFIDELLNIKSQL